MQTRQMLYALGMASLGLAAPAALAAPESVNQVTDLDIVSQENATRIVIVGTQPFTPTVRSLRRPNAVVITLPGEFRAGRSGVRSVNRNGVSFVRCGQFRVTPEKKVQIVANNRQALTVTTEPSADRTRWEVVVWAPGQSPDKKAATQIGDRDDRLAADNSGGADAMPSSLPIPALSHVSLTPKAGSPATMRQASMHDISAPIVPIAAPALAASPMVSSALTRAGAHTVGVRPASGMVSNVVFESFSHPSVRLVTPTLTEASATTAAAVVAAPARTLPRLATPRITARGTTPATIPPATLPIAVAAPVAGARTAPALSGADARPVQDPGDRLVSLDFVNADITDVLKAISLQSKVNVVAGSNVTGKVTVTLQMVPLREAMDWVTRLSGFRYARVGNTYIVGSGADLALLRRTPSVSDATNSAIAFFYSEGGSLLSSIKAAYPNVNITLVSVGAEAREQATDPNGVGGLIAPRPAGSVPPVNPVRPGETTQIGESPSGMMQVLVKPRGGVLNVVGTREEVESVQRFVDETERGLIANSERAEKARIERMAGFVTETYDAHYVQAADLVTLIKERVPGVTVQLGPSQRPIGPTLGGSGTFSGNSTTTSGSGGLGGSGGGDSSPQGGSGGSGGGAGQGNTAAASAPTILLITGNPLDVAKAVELAKRLDVRVTMMEFQAEIIDVNSTDANRFGIAYDLNRPVQIGETNFSDLGTIGPSTTSGPGRRPNFGAIGRTPYSFSATLAALVQTNKARVLARPKLTALDGQSAVCFIGDQFKYIINVQQTQVGANIQTETATIGITLRVTAKSNGDGTMNLYVHPEVSTVSSFLSVPGTSVQLPQISTRFVDTFVRVKDGDTVALGGLVRKEDFTNVQKVPFLGDLPVLGSLFRQTDKRRNDSEVLVFITARIVKD